MIIKNKNYQEKQNYQKWNDFLLANEGSFLQSFERGSFFEKRGQKICRLLITENEQTLCQALVVKNRLFLKKSFFYVPFGPCYLKSLTTEEKKKINQLLIDEIRLIAKKENVVFCLIEPFCQDFLLVDGKNIKNQSKRFQPQKTLLLDLQKSEQELLAELSAKCRYNINLARKKGVSISLSDEYQEDFFRLLQKTSHLKEWTSFKEDYYKLFFSKDVFPLQTNKSQPLIKMVLAEFENKIIAAYIFVVFGKQAICLHGASDKKYNHLKAVNLLNWQRILFAQKMGCRTFDFWGIDEKKWPGITAFKKSFGGFERQYPQEQDIVFDFFCYNAYIKLKKIKKFFQWLRRKF